jgi:hypothetical protein
VVAAYIGYGDNGYERLAIGTFDAYSASAVTIGVAESFGPFRLGAQLSPASAGAGTFVPLGQNLVLAWFMDENTVCESTCGGYTLSIAPVATGGTPIMLGSRGMLGAAVSGQILLNGSSTVSPFGTPFTISPGSLNSTFTWSGAISLLNGFGNLTFNNLTADGRAVNCSQVLVTENVGIGTPTPINVVTGDSSGNITVGGGAVGDYGPQVAYNNGAFAFPFGWRYADGSAVPADLYPGYPLEIPPRTIGALYASFAGSAAPSAWVKRDINVTHNNTIATGTALDAIDIHAGLLVSPWSADSSNPTYIPPAITTPVHDGAFVEFPLVSWPTTYPKGDALAIGAALDSTWAATQVGDPSQSLPLQVGTPNGGLGSVASFFPLNIAKTTSIEVNRPDGNMPSTWVAAGSGTVVESTGYSTLTATGSGATFARTLLTNWPMWVQQSSYAGTGFTYLYQSAYANTAHNNPKAYFGTTLGLPGAWHGQEDVWGYGAFAYLEIHLDCPTDMPANQSFVLQIDWSDLKIGDPDFYYFTARIGSVDCTEVQRTSHYSLTAQPGAGNVILVDLLFPDEGQILGIDRARVLTLSGLPTTTSGGVYTLRGMYLKSLSDPYVTLGYSPFNEGTPRGLGDPPITRDNPIGSLTIAQDGAQCVFAGAGTDIDEYALYDNKGGSPPYAYQVFESSNGIYVNAALPGAGLYQHSTVDWLAFIQNIEGFQPSSYTQAVEDAALKDWNNRSLGPAMVMDIAPILPFQKGGLPPPGPGATPFFPPMYLTVGNVTLINGVDIAVRAVHSLWGGLQAQVASPTTKKRPKATDAVQAVYALHVPDIGSPTVNPEVATANTDTSGYVVVSPVPAGGTTAEPFGVIYQLGTRKAGTTSPRRYALAASSFLMLDRQVSPSTLFPAPMLPPAGQPAILRHYTDRALIHHTDGSGPNGTGQMLVDLLDDNDGNPTTYTIDTTPTCGCPFFDLNVDRVDGTYLQGSTAVVATSNSHGRTWNLTPLSGSYLATTSTTANGRLYFAGCHDNRWWLRVGGLNADGTYTVSAETALSPATALISPVPSGHIRARDDGTVEFVYLDTSGAPWLMQGMGISTSGAGTWVTSSLPGNYSAATSTLANGRCYLLGYHDSEWWVRTGVLGAGGAYTWSGENSLGISGAQAQSFVRARNDGTVEFVYLDSTSALQILRGRGIDTTGAGIWT